MDKSFSGTLRIITPINPKVLSLFTFACIMDFQIRNFMIKQEIVGKNAQCKLNVFNVVHVAGHVDVARTDRLLKNKFILVKIRRKSFKRFVEYGIRKTFFRIS